VSDFKAAVNFYGNILGLPKRSQWTTYVVFDVCGMMLGIEPGGEGGAKKGTPDINLQVDNVDETYRDLTSKGVRFLTEPKDQTWGARTADFKDLDGNVFTLVQLKK
jgi:catechol 2,3-dioxygenase-like lactoylglutathione lyase family enzyme